MNITSPVVLYTALAIAFAAVALLAMVILPQASARRRGLRTALSPYVTSRKRTAARPFAGTLERVAGSLERLPSMRRYSERVERRLELAGWPLRGSEFLGLRAGGAFAGLLVGWGLLGSALLAILLPAMGVLVPGLILKYTIDRRSDAFREQLPDVLNLLAGSLEAGHGLLQGIDAVVQDGNAPASTEFSRALTEIRLGMPLGDALGSMADRVGGEEFRWVVLAMNIQREVGGNLASVLKTVSDTLRERDQLQRQVKVLSAEGRISAVILSALPFVLALYIAVVNPSYLGLLFGTPVGRLMVIGSLALMAAGGLWMRKLVRIEV